VISPLLELAVVLVRLDHVASTILNARRLWKRIRNTDITRKEDGRSMKSRPQDGETTALIDRAQRALLDSRELLEQREAQLKQREQFLVRTYQKLGQFMELEAAIRGTTP
jgi:hypothetical protein